MSRRPLDSNSRASGCTPLSMVPMYTSDNPGGSMKLPPSGMYTSPTVLCPAHTRPQVRHQQPHSSKRHACPASPAKPVLLVGCLRIQKPHFPYARTHMN